MKLATNMAKKKALQPRNDELMNYLFRPAKNIERKMLCEALSRLSVISDVKHYQYVGFGSVYFADFSLFHKQLGIQKLISIECDEDMETRVRFNQPYSCIDDKVGRFFCKSKIETDRNAVIRPFQFL